MEKALIKTHYRAVLNPELFPRLYERNILPSLTVPDQTMSIQEILERHTRGLGIDQGKVPMYYGDDEVLDQTDLKKLDLSELQELREANAEKLEAMREELIEKGKKKRYEAMRQKIKDEIEFEEIKNKKTGGNNDQA